MLCGSLLAHELAHSLVARRNGVQVEGITLWLFAGGQRFTLRAAAMAWATPPGAEMRNAT